MGLNLRSYFLDLPNPTSNSVLDFNVLPCPCNIAFVNDAQRY